MLEAKRGGSNLARTTFFFSFFLLCFVFVSRAGPSTHSGGGSNLARTSVFELFGLFSREIDGNTRAKSTDTG